MSEPVRVRDLAAALSPGRTLSRVGPEVSVGVLDVTPTEVRVVEPAGGGVAVLHALQGHFLVRSDARGSAERRTRSHLVGPGEGGQLRVGNAKVAIAVLAGQRHVVCTEQQPLPALFESIAALCVVATRRPSLGAESETAIAAAILGLAGVLAEPVVLTSDAGVYADATRIIQQCCAEPRLSVERLAWALGVTPRHLQRVFRAEGKSPGSEIRRHRLALSDELLRENPHLSVQELARACGFGSTAALRRARSAAAASTPPD